MKRPRAPFAKRSVWIAVAILAALLVIGGAVAAYEINHLRDEVNHLQSQVNLLAQFYLQKGK